jgi:hypothetical protein
MAKTNTRVARYDAIIGTGQAGPPLAPLLGTGCDEVIHGILDLIYAKAPYTLLQRTMPIHPTVSELLPTLLGDLKPL